MDGEGLPIYAVAVNVLLENVCPIRDCLDVCPHQSLRRIAKLIDSRKEGFRPIAI